VRNPLLAIGAALVAGLAVCAAASDLIAPYDPNGQDILARLSGPSGAHWLGTDNFGRDVASRILAGLRVLFAVSFLSVLAALVLGGAIGILSAWQGGWTERVAMRVMDVFFAFPIILLAIGVVAVLGPGVIGTAIAIGVVYTPIFARSLRAPARLLLASDYIEAARATGAGTRRILLRHLLPNLAPVILVQASLALSTAMLVEASLSFLGLGTQPPTASLGRMLAESRAFMALSPWPALFSGLAILVAAFGFNLLGDGLQDRLDPRLRGRS
jgi:peptide/nickel transport system permease protein